MPRPAAGEFHFCLQFDALSALLQALAKQPVAEIREDIAPDAHRVIRLLDDLRPVPQFFAATFR